MGDKEDLIEELKKEFKGQKLIIYPGPKKKAKAWAMIIVVLSLMFGLSMLTTRRLPTGHSVFAYNPTNWPAIILLIIPLMLVVYWWVKQ